MKRFTEEENKIIKELAKRNNVKESCIKSRLTKNNYSFLKVDYPNKERRIKYYYKGKPAVDIAAENGIGKNKFNSRIKLGWSIEKACTYNEPSLKEISIKTGINKKTIENYVYKKRIPKKYILENFKKGVDIKKNMI